MMKPAEMKTRPTRSTHSTVRKKNRTSTSITPTAMSPATSATYQRGLSGASLGIVRFGGVGALAFGLRRLDSGMGPSVPTAHRASAPYLVNDKLVVFPRVVHRLWVTRTGGADRTGDARPAPSPPGSAWAGRSRARWRP